MLPVRILLVLAILVAAPTVVADPWQSAVDVAPQLPPTALQGEVTPNGFNISWAAPPTATGVSLVTYDVYRFDPAADASEMHLRVTQVPGDQLYAIVTAGEFDEVFFYIIAVNDDDTDIHIASEPISPLPYPPCGIIGLWLTPPPPSIGYIMPACAVPNVEKIVKWVEDTTGV